MSIIDALINLNEAIARDCGDTDSAIGIMMDNHLLFSVAASLAKETMKSPNDFLEYRPGSEGATAMAYIHLTTQGRDFDLIGIEPIDLSSNKQSPQASQPRDSSPHR